MAYNSHMTERIPPKRTQAERTRQRKEQLIREATRQFGQYGFRGARLADIAQAAGVTEPGLLHHYPSKVHLLMDVLAERDRANLERYGVALHGGPGGAESLQALVEHNQMAPGLVKLFTVLVGESIDPDHPSHDFFVQRYQTYRAQLAEGLRTAQAQGEIRSDLSPEDLAVMIFAMMDGLQVQWLLEPEQVDMARIFGLFLQLLRG